MSTNSAVSSPFVTGLRCLRCGQRYGPTASEYVCSCRPNQGSDLGTLDVRYDYAAIQAAITPQAIIADRAPGIGRYWPLLPIGDRSHLTPLTVGDTPLLSAPRLGATLGLQKLYLKDDGRNPSSSFKDRASAIAVARARAADSPIIATASTGNAAAALASQCAAVGQTNVILVPESAPPAKLAQLLAYGSHVLAIDGSYDQAFDLCTQACQTLGWYNRNTGYNPYMTEGKKTVSYEIAQQLAAIFTPASPRFLAPDVVFVAVGDGSIIGGVHKGFKDLLALGWIEKLPRIYGVQSTKSDALYQAWRHGWAIPQPVDATTRADSISVNAPRDPIKALNAVRETEGAFVAVPDEEILGAILPMARLGAVFAEPAGATALAGLAAAVTARLVRADETVVVINIGSGLKDVAAAMHVTGGTRVIPPTLEAIYSATKEITSQ